MTDSSNLREYMLPRAEEYSEFGPPYNADDTSDPTLCCMPGTMFTCQNRTADLGLCPNFMSQKCANKWDETCDIYFASISDWNVRKNFLNKAAEKKFCGLEEKSKCTKLCQPFDPIAQSSEEVCDFVGSETTSLGDDIQNPTYMTLPCNKKCDLLGPDVLTADDPIINRCLMYGICTDVLSNICDTADKTNITLIHPDLQNLCQLRKANAPKIVDPSPAIPAGGVVQPKLSSVRQPYRKNNSVYEMDNKLIGLIVGIAILIVLFVILFVTMRCSGRKTRR